MMGEALTPVPPIVGSAAKPGCPTHVAICNTMKGNIVADTLTPTSTSKELTDAWEKILRLDAQVASLKQRLNQAQVEATEFRLQLKHELAILTKMIG